MIYKKIEQINKYHYKYFRLQPNDRTRFLCLTHVFAF